MSDFVYLDNNATTALDTRVLDAMLPYFKEFYGNPASSHHFGHLINRAIDEAREKISDLINAEAKEIVFTSGATEAINLAIKGTALHTANQKRHIITVQTEHRALLDTCTYLETIGFDVTYLPVQADGILDLEILKSNIRNETFLIAVMLGNNETGVIQNIRGISELAHERGVFVMSDATQAVGKIPIDVLDLDVDLLTFSSHKMHGPKGIGALYVKKSKTKKIAPLIHGGGHEGGLRSGTLNVAGIVGFGEACAIAHAEMHDYEPRVRMLRDELEKKLLQVHGSRVNGNIIERLYNVTNICFEEFDANAFIGKNKTLAVSNGSACSSAVFEPSHVLLAMGLSDDDAFGSIRFSLGKYTMEADVEAAIKLIEREIAVKN